MATNVYRMTQTVDMGGPSESIYQGYMITTSSASAEVVHNENTWDVVESLVALHFPDADEVRCAGFLLAYWLEDDSEFFAEKLREELGFAEGDDFDERFYDVMADGIDHLNRFHARSYSDVEQEKERMLEELFQSALDHGQDSSPDHEVGDLQSGLQLAFRFLTEPQAWAVTQRVKQCSEG